MSTKKPKRGNKGKGSPKQHQTAKAPQSKGLVNAVVAVCTIIGFMVALLTLFPRLSVSNTSSIDPSDPFSTPFRITNAGYLPLFSVKFSVAIEDARTRQGGGVLGSPNYESRVHPTSWKADVFWPTDSFDLYLGDIISAHDVLAFGDIAIVVRYHPFAIPVKRERRFRFITHVGPDGKLHWQERSFPGSS